MNIGTTSIDSLPISQPMQPMQQPQQQMQAPPPPPMQQQQAPSMQYTPDNIRLEVNNIKVDNPAQALQQTRDNDPALMQKNMNQFISGIQQASAAGMTALPSRDIPQNQDHLVQDQQIKANFIPSPLPNQQGGAGGDYISNYKTSDDIIRENMRREKKTDSLDAIYNEFQVPILIAVLFFLFQLPIIRKNMFKFLPMLFSKDGNFNISGYVSNSVLFGLAYYVMTKTINHFSL